MRAYKIGIIGLGSIGRRHLLNIVIALKERNRACSIDLIRSKKGQDLDSEVAEHINRVYYAYDEVPGDYDVLFITNITKLHFNTIQLYVNKTKHMFIEKPVFDREPVSIEDLKLNNEGIYYVAAPMRYTNIIQYLKNHLKTERVYSVRAICSSYLPEWRPGQDYRFSYSAHRDQGGGVSLDLIHEWDFLCYLLGLPEKVVNFNEKFSELLIDSDDLSIYIAKYETFTVEVHLDYFGRKDIREIQIFMDDDTIEADFIKSEIRFLKKGTKISFKEERNDYHYKEIVNFFDIIEGITVNENDIIMAHKILEIAKGGD